MCSIARVDQKVIRSETVKCDTCLLVMIEDISNIPFIIRGNQKRINLKLHAFLSFKICSQNFLSVGHSTSHFFAKTLT